MITLPDALDAAAQVFNALFPIFSVVWGFGLALAILNAVRKATLFDSNDDAEFTSNTVPEESEKPKRIGVDMVEVYRLGDDGEIFPVSHYGAIGHINEHAPRPDGDV